MSGTGKLRSTAKILEGEEAKASRELLARGERAANGFHDHSSPSHGKGAAEPPPPPHKLTARSPWIRQLEKAIRRSYDHFSRTQHSDGYWWAELESNVTITAEYIMLLHLLGLWDQNSRKTEGMVKYILGLQSPNGSWGIFHGDPGNIGATVEAYFALTLAGQDKGSEPLRRARRYILEHGGVESPGVFVFTKTWLALFGQYDWDKIPSMPVELVLLPDHLYFNIYEFSSWARGTAVPLSIVLSLRPTLELPPELSITELFAPDSGKKHFKSNVHRLFYLFDRVAKIIERRPIVSLKRKAIRKAEEWIIDHQETSGDWGGIQPPMVYSVLALHYLGYSVDHEAMAKGLKAIEDFCVEDEQGFRMQSCLSPVWDTALTCLALQEAGFAPEDPAVRNSARWLVEQQVRSGGDWQVKNPKAPAGGWAFEFVNTQYPDVDDSAVVLNALNRFNNGILGHLDLEKTKKLGFDWCLSMQSSNGGWAAFDKDNTMDILNRIPFADHEAMVDNPTADVTGRMLEIMGILGYDSSHPAAARGLRFLKQLQEPDGCWWGRWGVNYVYGTWSVMRGLQAIGEDLNSKYIRNAMHWIKDHQNADGGWGEVCESYECPELRGQGPSTASQTAWAIMALIAGGEEESLEVSHGVQYLLRTQQPDGTWEEKYFTGTGFPKHFFIRYHNYRNCFPLMALGQYLQRTKG